MIHLLAAFDADRSIRHWIEHGGYAVLFGLLFSCGLGMPLPEDIPLLVAGAMVATGKFNLAIACICAWCGIVGGDCVLYSIGRKFGDEVPRIPFIGRHVSLARMQRVHTLFEKWGVWVVAVGRLFAGIRGAMVVVAGASRFTFWKFIVADGLAAMVSGGLFLYLGYVFGNHLHQLNEHVHTAKRYMIGAAIVVAVVVGAFVWWKNRKRHPDPDPTSAAKSLLEPVNPTSITDHAKSGA